MPRIRTIKPEMFGDEKLAPMPVIDRFVFVGLIAMADDAGRLVDNVKTIDGFVFPETDDTARESLVRLAAVGRIVRYRSESGQKLIQIANWSRHQKVDHAAKYVLPAPAESDLAGVSRDARENDATVSRSDLRPVPVPTTSTSDQGPTTAAPVVIDARPSGDVTASEIALRQRLPREFWMDLDALLDARPADARRSWCARLAAHIDGQYPPMATPEQLGDAVRDFVAGAQPGAGLKLFAGFVRRVVDAPARAAPSGRPFRSSRDTAGEETYANAIAAVDAMTGMTGGRAA